MPTSGPDRSQETDFKVYAGDVGTIIRILTDIDLTDTTGGDTGVNILVQKPDGTICTWAALREAPYTGGVIYTQTTDATISDDQTSEVAGYFYFEQTGEYLLQAYTLFSGPRHFRGETVAVTAHALFD